MDNNKNTLSPWMMLVMRSLLFFLFQMVIGLVFFTAHPAGLWEGSAAWWPITVILTDLIGLALLIHFYRQEGLRFWDVFRIERQNLKKNLLFMLGSLVVLGPVGFLPNILSAQWLFGDSQVALDLLVRPLPVWAAVLGFAAFPLLQGLVELPTYTLFVMPRLEKQGVRPWLAVTLTGLFLSAQHIFIPFIPDLRFITYRMVMFLPFAYLIVIILHKRPRLIPFFAVIHALMNFSISVMFLFLMK